MRKETNHKVKYQSNFRKNIPTPRIRSGAVEMVAKKPNSFVMENENEHKRLESDFNSLDNSVIVNNMKL